MDKVFSELKWEGNIDVMEICNSAPLSKVICPSIGKPIPPLLCAEEQTFQGGHNVLMEREQALNATMI